MQGWYGSASVVGSHAQGVWLCVLSEHGGLVGDVGADDARQLLRQPLRVRRGQRALLLLPFWAGHRLPGSLVTVEDDAVLLLHPVVREQHAGSHLASVTALPVRRTKKLFGGSSCCWPRAMRAGSAAEHVRSEQPEKPAHLESASRMRNGGLLVVESSPRQRECSCRVLSGAA